MVRSLIPAGDFIESFCSCPLTVCEQRNIKGLYKQMSHGEIKNFTALSSVYEEPDIKIDTNQQSVEECVQLVMSLLHSRNILSRSTKLVF